MQHLMPHHLLFTLFFFNISFASDAFNEMEHKSLVSLPFKTSSPPLNWSSNDYCQWEGISCDPKGKVTHIWLPSRGLTGSLSASLENLTYLSHLNLSRNSLFGCLPKEMFSSLSKLKVLDLSNNHLSGDIRDTFALLDSIQILDISCNYFNGTIPSLFFQRSWRLIMINVSNNNFIGPIPSFPCTNFSLIMLLDFSRNDHNGQIPSGLGACSNLKVFRAGFNSLSGPLPHDIYHATRLEDLSLPSNNLSGSIGSIVNLTKLTNLELYDNKLRGKLPENIGKLSQLKYLLLGSNSLTGPLPSSLVNCTNLKKLILRFNHLEGDISTFNFSTLRQLTIIDLAFNNFSGNLPISLYSCKSLIAIRLSQNMFEGQIAQEVVQLKSLSFLSLSANRLTNVTMAFKILQHCKSLSVLFLGGNFPNEAIPGDDSIFGSNRFKNLQLLDLTACQLTGQLPKWISMLKKLEVLGLASNRIKGSIPSWLSTLPSLFHLDLNDNLFSGEFPKEFCTMPSLVSMEAQRKKSYLSLTILVYGDFNRGFQYNTLSNMKPAIFFSSNHLTGNIPIEISRLKALHQLDLSCNNFSGNIPKQIAELTNLELLDLSSNQFSGEIPSSIIDLHFLSHFNVASNHLHGQIPSGTQLQSFDASAYEGNLELCGPPLPKCAPIVKSIGDKYIPYKEDKLGMPWFLISVAVGFIVGFWGVCGPLLYNYKWRVAYFQFLDTKIDWFYLKLGVLQARLSIRL